VGAVSFTTHVNHGLEGVFAASARIGQSNGRPGANHLRVERTVCMPERSWTALRDFVVANDYAFPGTFAVVPNIMVYEDRLRIGADWYVPADAPGYSYRENPADLREILRNLRNAALQDDPDPIDPGCECEACRAIAPLGERGRRLEALAHFVLERDH
jgi:hypothetical protein